MDNYYLLYNFNNSESYWVVKISENIDDIKKHVKKSFSYIDTYCIVKPCIESCPLLSNERLFTTFDFTMVNILTDLKI